MAVITLPVVLEVTFSTATWPGKDVVRSADVKTIVVAVVEGSDVDADGSVDERVEDGVSVDGVVGRAVGAPVTVVLVAGTAVVVTVLVVVGVVRLVLLVDAAVVVIEDAAVVVIEDAAAADAVVTDGGDDGVVLAGMPGVTVGFEEAAAGELDRRITL